MIGGEFESPEEEKEASEWSDWPVDEGMRVVGYAGFDTVKAAMEHLRLSSKMTNYPVYHHMVGANGRVHVRILSARGPA